MSLLDLHYSLLDQLKEARSDRRTALALALTEMAEAVAREYQEAYPGKPLPVHPAFTRAAIDLERLGDFKAAIGVCQKAITSGWQEEPHRVGDWERRIARNNAKLSRHPR